MLTMSQLLAKLSPPYIKAGNVERSEDNDWHVDIKQYKDKDYANAYELSLKIPYDPDIKVLRGAKGDPGEGGTITIGTVTSGVNPGVTNRGDAHDAILDIVLPKGVKGDKGDVGPQGPIGLRGAKGDTGPQGKASMVKVGDVDYSENGLVRVTGRYETKLDGSKETLIDFHFPKAIMTGGAGIDGKDGKDATIEVGQVIAGDFARVKNVGSDSNAILDFILPRGEKGERGSEGPQGERGPMGIAGKSAYEVALDNGFVGTEIEWLASLIGEKGEKGDKGDKGDTGATGATGAAGKDGTDGTSTTGSYYGSSEPLFPEVSVQSVTTSAPGTEAKVWCNSTKDGRIVRFNFVIPRGYDGSGNYTDTDGNGISLTKVSSIKIGKTTSGTIADVTNVGSDTNMILDFVLPKGEDGKDAYHVAVDNGYIGTVQDWLQSLKATPSSDGGNNSGNGGKSAYDIAVENGYTGSAKAWLASLKGERGANGLSAYEIACKNGTGYPTEAEWLASLKGEKGADGKNAGISLLDVGNITTGAKADVKIREVATGSYLIDFTFPVNTTSDETNSSTRVSAKNVYFSDGQSLQTKLLQNTLADLTLGVGSGSGKNGKDGADATIQVSSTVNYSGKTISISNTGTTSAANLVFTFPSVFKDIIDGKFQPQTTTTSVPTDVSNWPVFLDKQGNIAFRQTTLVPSRPNEDTIGNVDNPFASGYFYHMTVGGYSLYQRKVFTNSGTFKVPTGTKVILVTACAGGGGGAAGCGGGGGEGCFRKAIDVTDITVLNIIVGTGGMGNTNICDVNTVFDAGLMLNGGDGNATAVGELNSTKGIYLNGGQGGRLTIGNPPIFMGGIAGGSYSCNGGHVSVCDIREEVAVTPEGESITGQRTYWNGGNGGGSLFGSGGNGGIVNPGNLESRMPGSTGAGFGSGGGGGAIVMQNGMYVTTAGGSGANGIVIIEWA